MAEVILKNICKSYDNGFNAVKNVNIGAKESTGTARITKVTEDVAERTSAVAIETVNEADAIAKSAVESSNKVSSDFGRVWDYSRQFEGELDNFNSGYKIKNIVDKDLYLVQFHSSAEVGNGRSLKYWTTFDEANGISTVDGYMNRMALMSNWGARDNVSVAKIPAGTKIKYAVGTAKEQVGAIESRPGGGLQVLFEQFNDSWVIETRPLL